MASSLGRGAFRERVIRERAGQTIEVGLGYGVSALFLCDGLLAAGDPLRLALIRLDQAKGRRELSGAPGCQSGNGA